MEIKFLNEQAIPQAVYVARGVFDHQIRGAIMDASLTQAFDEYVNEESLRKLYLEGRLFLWGIYADGQLCAVSGMQREGHITMLYVLPFYRKRKMGISLLKEMKRYAADVLGLDRLTVNALPAWSAGFFQRGGFRQMDPRQGGMSRFVCMEAKIAKETTYPIKPLSEKVIVGVTSGYLGLAFLSVVLFFLIY